MSTWTAYAAGWALVFAALSFYWALGGTWLAATQYGQILGLAESR